MSRYSCSPISHLTKRNSSLRQMKLSRHLALEPIVQPTLAVAEPRADAGDHLRSGIMWRRVPLHASGRPLRITVRESTIKKAEYGR